jgi:anti-sigma regulatory factor (Ser/Thr protein kinase)
VTTVVYQRGASLAQLRRAVLDWAEDHALSEPFDLTLVVDELVTNAIVHGNAERVTVHLDMDGTQVLLAVDDPSDTAPLPAARPHLHEQGRGLLIVETLSSGWGWTEMPVGKRVWCRIGQTRKT